MTCSAACDHEQGWKIATFAILRAMLKPTRSAVRALALLLVCAAATAAAPVRQFDCSPEAASEPAQTQGRLLILPGVGNTRFHLAGFVAAAKTQLPRFDVEVRPWGVPFMTIHNLRAHE